MHFRAVLHALSGERVVSTLRCEIIYHLIIRGAPINQINDRASIHGSPGEAGSCNLVGRFPGVSVLNPQNPYLRFDLILHATLMAPGSVIIYKLSRALEAPPRRHHGRTKGHRARPSRRTVSAAPRPQLEAWIAEGRSTETSRSHRWRP